MSEELKPWPIGPQKGIDIECAIKYMKEMRSICDTDDGFVPQVYDMAIAALRRAVQQPNEPLTLEHVDCKTCQFEDRSPDEEPCRHCKGAYANRYAHKPEAGEKE